MSEFNPYSAPEVDEAASDADENCPEGRTAVRNGRILYVVVCLLIVLFEAAQALIEPSEWQLVRAGVTAVLLVLGWYGSEGAITALFFGFLVAGMYGLIVAMYQPSLPAWAVPVAMVGLIVLFVQSESLNAFFRYQRRRHLPPPDPEALEAERVAAALPDCDGPPSAEV